MSSNIRFKNGNVNKEDDFITLQSGNIENILDNFETYLKISNAYVHRCKMFQLHSANYSSVPNKRLPAYHF